MNNRYSTPVSSKESGVAVVRRYNKAFVSQRYLKPTQQMQSMC